jgi:hypothetical protein
VAGGTSSSGTPSTYNITLMPGSIQLNAADLSELQYVYDFFGGLTQAARAGGIPAHAAGAR